MDTPQLIPRQPRKLRAPRKASLYQLVRELSEDVARLRAENETLRGQRVSPHLPEPMPSCPPPTKRAMREEAPGANWWRRVRRIWRGYGRG